MRNAILGNNLNQNVHKKLLSQWQQKIIISCNYFYTGLILVRDGQQMPSILLFFYVNLSLFDLHVFWVHWCYGPVFVLIHTVGLLLVGWLLVSCRGISCLLAFGGQQQKLKMGASQLPLQILELVTSWVVSCAVCTILSTGTVNILRALTVKTLFCRLCDVCYCQLSSDGLSSKSKFAFFVFSAGKCWQFLY